MAKRLTRAMAEAPPKTETEIREEAKAASPDSSVETINGRLALVKVRPTGDREIHWLN